MTKSEIVKLQEIENRFNSVIAYNHDIPDDELNDILTEIDNMIKPTLSFSKWMEKKLLIDISLILFPPLLSKLWYIGDSIKFFLRRK